MGASDNISSMYETNSSLKPKDLGPCVVAFHHFRVCGAENVLATGATAAPTPTHQGLPPGIEAKEFAESRQLLSGICLAVLFHRQLERVCSKTHPPESRDCATSGSRVEAGLQSASEPNMISAPLNCAVLTMRLVDGGICADQLIQLMSKNPALANAAAISAYGSCVRT